MCSNETRALWAKYKEPRCAPSKATDADALEPLEDAELKTCLDMKDVGSMAFKCEGLPDSELPKAKDPKNRGGSFLFAMLLFFGILGLMLLLVGLTIYLNARGMLERVKVCTTPDREKQLLTSSKMLFQREKYGAIAL